MISILKSSPSVLFYVKIHLKLAINIPDALGPKYAVQINPVVCALH